MSKRVASVAVVLGLSAASGALAQDGKGTWRTRRWITPPVPGFTTNLLLPAPLPID
jgi:hypothetical protein